MSGPGRLPTPREMVAHLDRFVRGQFKAKRDLADAFYRHYLSLAARESGGEGARPAPHHVLLLGPTGCGKTLLVRTLCALLDVPAEHTSATTLTETGYAGDDVEAPVARLWRRAGHDRRRAERGVIVLDEIDKIRIARDGHRDISGEGVQNGLLTLLDGRIVHVRDERRATDEVDAARLLFVCLGAFMDLPGMARGRGRAAPRLGFRAALGAARRPEAPGPDAWERATADDLVRYGFLPEFVGRFPTVTAVRPLDADDLHALLVETEDSPVERERAHLALHGIALEVEDAALRALADRALERGTGARGLHHGLRQALADVSWQAPDLAAEGVTRVVVTRACVLGVEAARCERHRAPGGRAPAEALRAAALGGSATAARAVPRRRRGAKAEERGAGASPARAGAGVAGGEDADGDAPAWPAWCPTGDGAGDDEVRRRLAELETGRLALTRAGAAAQAWWRRLRAERPLRTVAALALALARRGATVEEFHAAACRSGSRGIEATLRFLDYERARAAWQGREDLRRLLEADDPPGGAARDDRRPPVAALESIEADSLPPPLEDERDEPAA
uniref:AAA family ATPase n=1 Tax=Eiseniibacteriota bacterium TaxID=2212470 RepID=A0A832I4N7_UNCEI